MSDQSIFLDWKVNTAQLGDAERKLKALNSYLAAMADAGTRAASGTDRVAAAANRAKGSFDGVGQVAFQAGQAVQDFAIGLDQGLGKALMFSINNLSFIAQMLGGGGAFAVGMQVATTGVALLAQNWERLVDAIGATDGTAAAVMVRRLGDAANASADNAAAARAAKDAIGAAAGMAGAPNAADRKAAGEWQGRIDEIGFDRVRGEIVRGMRAGLSDEEFLRKFGYQGIPGLAGSSSLEQYQAQRNDPGRQNAIMAEALKLAEKEAGERLMMAGTDPAQQRSLIATLGRQNPQLAAQLSGETARAKEMEAALDEENRKALAEEIQRKRKIEQDFAREQARRDDERARKRAEAEERFLAEEQARWDRNAAEQAGRRRAFDQRRAEERRREFEAADPQRFADAAVDRATGGGVDPQWLAARMRQRRLLGQTAEQAQIGTTNEIAGMLRAMSGGVMAPSEAVGQAMRLTRQAMPEAQFLGEQMRRVAEMQPRAIQAQERLDARLGEILRKGTPIYLPEVR